MKKEPKIGGREYDSNAFYWAKMYRNRIQSLHDREGDVRGDVLKLNREWERNGWNKEWSVKRFKLYFRGEEIDSYEHSWERNEKRLSLVEKMLGI